MPIGKHTPTFSADYLVQVPVCHTIFEENAQKL